MKPYKALPTKINITTPLKSAPPKGKTIVMLGTNNPSNVIIQQGLAKLAKMAGWNFSVVSYDPANPGTFTRRRPPRWRSIRSTSSRRGFR